MDRRSRAFDLAVIGAMALISGQPKSMQAKKPPQVTFAKDVKPFAAKYCLKCHTGSANSGIFAINTFPDAKSLKSDPTTWSEAADYLDAKKMPPASATQPPVRARHQVSRWIRDYLSGKLKE